MLSRDEILPRTLVDAKYHKSSEFIPDPPYLTNISEPIEVNLGRQLWVDDYLISKSNNLKRVYHQAVDVKSDPILSPTPTENRSNSPLPDAVLYDPIQREFKMWYVPNYEYTPHRMALAVSKDGINWIRKKLPSDYQFKTHSPCCDKCPKYNENRLKSVTKEQNNLIGSFGGCRNFHGRGSGNVIIDLKEKDPNKRFKLAWGGFRNLIIYYSPDGINWTEADRTGGWVGGSVWYLCYNPFRDSYVYSLRDNLPHLAKGRMVRFMEVKHELDTWPKWEDGSGNGYRNYLEDHPVPFCVADHLDVNYTRRRPGTYCAHLVPYENLMVNLFCVYHGGDGFHKRCSLYAGFSRDGFHYTRDNDPKERKPLIPETFKKFYILATGGNLCLVNERIHLYYIYKHGKSMYCGLSTLRRDGFVSLQSEDNNQETMVETKLLTYTVDQSINENQQPRKYLFVNVDTSEGGYLTAEILDQNEQVVPGYAATNFLSDESIKIKKGLIQNEDTTKKMITWGLRASLPADLDQFKIRFRFKQTKFYSFWISPSKYGESNGYLGHGGPAYLGYQDTVDNYLPENQDLLEKNIDCQVPTDESVTLREMSSMINFKKPLVYNPKENRAVARKKREIKAVKLPDNNDKLDNSRSTNNLNLNSNMDIITNELPVKFEQIQPIFCHHGQIDLNFAADSVIDSDMKTYNVINFDYYDILNSLKSDKLEGRRLTKKLNFPVVKIISNPIYELYNSRGGGPSIFGRVIKIKVASQVGQQDIVLIKNSRSNAIVSNLELSNE